MVYVFLLAELLFGLIEAGAFELAATAVALACGVYAGIGGGKAIYRMYLYLLETSGKGTSPGGKKPLIGKRAEFVARLSLECLCLAMLLFPPPVVLSIPHGQFWEYWLHIIAVVSGAISYMNNKLGRSFTA